jgi:hypothetical protein
MMESNSEPSAYYFMYCLAVDLNTPRSIIEFKLTAYDYRKL